jgi:hypothetical protein
MRQNLRMDLSYWPRRVARRVYGLGSWPMEAVVRDRSPEQVRAALASSIRPTRGAISLGLRYDSARHRIKLGVNAFGQLGDRADVQMDQVDTGGTLVSVVQFPNSWARIFMAVWLTLALGYVFGGVVALGLGLLYFIEDGQMADLLGGGALAAVMLAMFGLGRGLVGLARRSDTKKLQEVIRVAVGSDEPLRWVVKEQFATV